MYSEKDRRIPPFDEIRGDTSSRPGRTEVQMDRKERGVGKANNTEKHIFTPNDNGSENAVRSVNSDIGLIQLSSTVTPKLQAARRPHSKNAEQADDTQAHLHIEQLHNTIKKLTLEKEAAQQNAAKAVQDVEKMKQFIRSDMDDRIKDTERQELEIRKLKAENIQLKNELSDAQSHIFSLQPYRKELTMNDVGQQYDDLVEQVQDWVQRFMVPWLDDYEAGVDGIMTSVRKQPTEAVRFRRVLQKNPDLVHGSLFPETDEDILAAIILRFLNDNIFQTALYGADLRCTEMINSMEQLMRTAVTPKRDLFTIRTWTAECYNALLSAPHFQEARKKCSRDLTLHLADILKLFCQQGKFQWFCENLEEHCILPAMALYEKLQVSTHHYYLHMSSFMTWAPDSGILTTPEFLDSLSTLDCKDVLQNRKAFNISKLDPLPTQEELKEDLLNVCTVVPALSVRQIGQRDAIKAPVVVCKQQLLVAWGSHEKRSRFMNDGDQSIISHIYFNKSRKRGEDRA